MTPRHPVNVDCTSPSSCSRSHPFAQSMSIAPRHPADIDCASSLCLLPSHHRLRLFFASHSQAHLDCISPSSFRANSATGAIRNRPKCSRHGHVAAWRAELVTRGAIPASRARAVHGPRVQAACDAYAVPPAYPPSADALPMELILTPCDRSILIAPLFSRS